MPAYMLSFAKVKDAEAYEAYRQAALPLLEQWGVRYVARTAEVERLEGHWEDRVLAILEFPSREAAREFWNSPEYKKVAALRGEAAEMDVILIEGAA